MHCVPARALTGPSPLGAFPGGAGGGDFGGWGHAQAPAHIMAYKGWFLGHKLELVRMLPGVLAHAHLGL